MRFTILFIFILIGQIFAQISHGGTPLFFETRDIESSIIRSNPNNIIDRNFHPMVSQYGYEYNIDVNILDYVKPIYSNSTYTYLLNIKSDGAYGIGLIFNDFYLSENSTLFLYDNDRTIFLGAFTSLNNKLTSIFPTSIVKSDHIVIELNIPEDELHLTKLNIGTLIHDYTDIMNYYNSSSMDREDCNINVSCPESLNWADQVNGVVRVSMGGGLCSASLINNTLNDRTPYILFADHCVSGNANGYVFYFNYQSSTCSGSSGSLNQSVSGSTLLASESLNSGPDFALLEMSSTPPDSYNPFYVGWSKSSSPPEDAIGIHHPEGGIKKISFTNDNITANGYFWEFQYDDGRVIPGSSGSPFFDQNKRQVGIASYIYTNYCDPSPDCYCDQQYDHGYGRFDLAWNLGLSNYLDPLNSDVEYIDGISISGISISHTPMEDIPFENNTISIIVEVSAYTGTIEGVELHYDLGEGWTYQEMGGNFGNIYEGIIPNIYDGMIIEYYIMAVNSEGIVEYFPPTAPNNSIMFIVGDLPDIYFTDFENGLGDWQVGDLQDDASSGIWELAEPIASFNDEGNQVQPGEDYSLEGTYCFITGNGYEDGNGGFDDVDGGQTTLFSPSFSLENYDKVILSYHFWYTNNIGDNGGNDLWQVFVSNDTGNSWQEVHVTSASNNQWEKKRIILSDIISLSDDMQFKFVAEDLSYSGDAGSGGSLVEAAIDDFILEYVGSNSDGIIGDINYDGIINIQDVVILIDLILNSGTSNVPADMNEDGIINVSDIVILISIILN